jgi:hypothetical protein
MPVILATQGAEIRRIAVQSQLRQIIHETLFQKNPPQKRASGVAQGVGPEFKPQYSEKRKRKRKKKIVSPHVSKNFHKVLQKISSSQFKKKKKSPKAQEGRTP